MRLAAAFGKWLAVKPRHLASHRGPTGDADVAQALYLIESDDYFGFFSSTPHIAFRG
jgi:hypothetical protein